MCACPFLVMFGQESHICIGDALTDNSAATKLIGRSDTSSIRPTMEEISLKDRLIWITIFCYWDKGMNSIASTAQLLTYYTKCIRKSMYICSTQYLMLHIVLRHTLVNSRFQFQLLSIIGRLSKYAVTRWPFSVKPDKYALWKWWRTLHARWMHMHESPKQHCQRHR